MYLEIDEPKDTLDIPINDVLDINGWDLRKALKLLRKSNMPLFEWLQSPVVYKQDAHFLNELKQLMPVYFSPRASMHHYLSMANNCFENDLQSKRVKLKKYFYTLRPLLAAQWIAEKNEFPPMEFSVLRTLVNDKNWDAAIDSLLVEKKAADEKSLTEQVPLLHSFITTGLENYKSVASTFDKSGYSTALLNQFFRKQLNGFSSGT
ncbi:putative nucleotidyltransferase [compost metagenome]